MSRRVIEDVACTVCGCVCDDLAITVEHDRIVKAERACELAEPWFLSQAPAATVNLEPSIQRAAAILSNAKYPLIYGLSRSTTEGQRAAVALAEKLGACIDTTASTGHAPSIIAFQQAGESTCTLGEVRQRADLVIFWGCDPAVTHPRLLERYVSPNDPTIIVIDRQENRTVPLADAFLKVEENWRTLWTLRLLVAGKPVDAEPAIVELAKQMMACKFGIVIFGPGLTREDLAHRTIEALLQLVTDLNDHTRFYARRLRRFGDVAGADSVLTWQTGFPFAVSFATGAPRYGPGEFSGPELLARKEIDACLLVGSDAVADLPAAALEHLNSIPVIRLDPPNAVCEAKCEVNITTAVYGIHKPGTAYRMDEVPIPLKVLLPTELPSDADVLRRIHEMISSRIAVKPCLSDL